ncbi:hypothetical protein OG738_29920 [Amycolatopsis sp. NBC_01488]|uniref:hypothetical protein n=1 Tax=Amycolatopsis sp. NBC_01488 TaxID=2903563 RepID=UPI002E2C5C3A|nr:hypothetical protein [Amycolatopsis sp. NBC_01488]
MQIPFDPAAGVVRRGDDAGAGGGELRPAPAELGRPLGDLHLELVPGVPERLFGPSAFLDEPGVLEGRRGVVRGQ